MDFAYFQEHESEQFTFFRIPKILFTDKRFENLSSEAKILYGLMLDRVGLSRKNGWIDQHGNVFIQFSIEEMTSVLKWSRYRIFQLLDELDSKGDGIGLIERKRIGHCKPNIIYVKNFASANRTRGEPEVRQPDIMKSDISDFIKSDIQTSGSTPAGLHEVCEPDSSNTDRSKTERSNTEYSNDRKSEKEIRYGNFQNVIMADWELSELKSKFPYDWENRIERLSAYMESTGKKYRNHYATICSWAVNDQKNMQHKNYDIPGGKGF